ncbi:MAG: hypothetical protein HY652_08060 [Acidobacteria bacterium]|nr:hypothetical protein [Acidobacteriota bacterium]
MRMKYPWLTPALAILIAASVYAQRAPAPAAEQPKGQTVTLAGEVVDAACYMIHPKAAIGPAHKECGAACAQSGVPLAIANEADGKLYFPADGNKQLLALLGQRARVTGTAVDKSDPMELKMPVGEKNSMSVRVDGGYKVVTIETISTAPAKK